MISIEKILKLDKEITYRKLIYSKYQFSWKLLGHFLLLLIGIFLCCSWVFLDFDKTYYSFLVIIPVIVSVIIPGIISVKILVIISGMILIKFFTDFFTDYSLKEDKKIIKKYYPHVLPKNGNTNYIPLLKIRKEIIKNELKGKVELTPENLLFIIDCLRGESKKEGYNYSWLINIILVFISIYIGAYLGGFSEYFPFDEYTEIFKILGVILLPLIASTVIIFNEFRQDIIKRKYRLIRVFENICMEKRSMKKN